MRVDLTGLFDWARGGLTGLVVLEQKSLEAAVAAQ